ncbi:MAG TPA: thioredoxin domain-containing protein [Candidatus Saccharimonadales bacterium]|nr:thioredoxin domain-containing protein [Candidatus Saccharimonadales bacterium]
MSKQFLAVLVVAVLALFGIFTLTKKSSSDNQSGNGTQDKSSQLSEHKKGAGTAGVTLIEYGDFQCPICKQYYPIVQKVQETYGDKITFQFRNFPLTQLHPHAFEAARAAEAAGLQGKFWEMYDLLYQNQDTWAKSPSAGSIFASFAEQLSLDKAKFQADSSSEQVANIINADVRAAQDIGAGGTPTFVLNGKKLDKNPTDVEGFKQLIDAEIAKNN